MSSRNTEDEWCKPYAQNYCSTIYRLIADGPHEQFYELVALYVSTEESPVEEVLAKKRGGV